MNEITPSSSSSSSSSSKNLVGSIVRIRMDHLFDSVTFSAAVIRDEGGDFVTVRIPRRVRELTWTMFPERAYRFPRAKVLAARVK